MPNAPFLRPALTDLIIQRLSRGDSLNLYGEPGIGKTRLLEDIRDAKLLNTLVICVSIHVYKNSYSGFCRAIWAEAGLKDAPPTSFPDVIDVLATKKKRIFLLIDHFQSIVNTPDIDPAYNQAFIDALNAVKNKSGVSLLLASSEPINKFPLFVDKQPQTSVLNLDRVKTDVLSHQEISIELDRRAYKVFSGDELRQLASFLNDRPRNYGVLTYMDQRIRTDAGPHLELQKKWIAWFREFEKEQRPAPIKQAVKTKGWLKTWLIVVPYDTVLALIKNLMTGISKILKIIIPWFK